MIGLPWEGTCIAPNAIPSEIISEVSLGAIGYYHDYMFKRGLTEELIEKYDIGYDPKFKLKKNP